IKKSAKISKYLTQKLSREPTIEDIAKEMNIDRKILESITMFTHEILTTSSSYKNLHNNDISSLIEDKNLSFPHQKLFIDNLKDTITEALKYLNERERTVIIYRFGLYGKEPKTLEDTGKELNITRERVRQIQIKALKKLSDINLSNDLKNFLWD
ncbi:sigma factor-like helix-turn-helix DNA-binding protein, partial [Brachyspira catarrhinii]